MNSSEQQRKRREDALRRSKEGAAKTKRARAEPKVVDWTKQLANLKEILAARS